eukprot:1931113-Prymnesium_polylepis.1
MRGLGQLAARHGLHIQSHVSENRSEIAWVSSLHPEGASYTAVYDGFGLLTARTLLAHGVYLEPEERALLARRGAAVSHCPSRSREYGVKVAHIVSMGSGRTHSEFGVTRSASESDGAAAPGLSLIHISEPTRRS